MRYKPYTVPQRADITQPSVRASDYGPQFTLEPYLARDVMIWQRLGTPHAPLRTLNWNKMRAVANPYDTRTNILLTGA